MTTTSTAKCPVLSSGLFPIPATGVNYRPRMWIVGAGAWRPPRSTSCLPLGHRNRGSGMVLQRTHAYLEAVGRLVEERRAWLEGGDRSSRVGEIGRDGAPRCPLESGLSLRGQARRRFARRNVGDNTARGDNRHGGAPQGQDVIRSHRCGKCERLPKTGLERTLQGSLACGANWALTPVAGLPFPGGATPLRCYSPRTPLSTVRHHPRHALNET